MTDLADQIRILRDDAGLVVLDREVILATGEAVVDYLQGQLSQDVADMGPGVARWAFILQPQGKVDAWFRVTRLDEATFVLDIDAGWADQLLARLERFKLRTPVTFEKVDWQVTAARGPAVPTPAAPPDPARGLVVPVEWPGEVGWDLIGDGGADLGLPECEPAAAEALRIEAGRPRMGHELDDATIPNETGMVPLSVSFTKGCYTGQELVARLDSRGNNTPRRLVGIHLTGPVESGTPLLHEDKDVGRITSVAAVSSFGHPVALAYLARGVDLPADLDAAGEQARAVALPLVEDTTA